ncbi:GNAT family N-acetyltransferase [Paenibacillus sp. NPDC058071]|uniref:GNAT family N-acetyltransferase n=1 Tax=Paenibacillus sp. NPDC058071 TaxID=3346326 RepID=UPI0036DE052F
MTNVYLSKPSLELKEGYLEFYKEWMDSGEEAVPWVIEREPEPFEEMVQWLTDHGSGVNLPEGWVPDSTFWLTTDTGEVLGVVNIRHRLTPFLLNEGGHIGYGIRPSERRKGYATKLLQLALVEAKQLGIDKALVVCDESNVASERTIRINGGVPDRDYIPENGEAVRRFWIDL